jgi:hypothetical protein
MFAPSVYLLCLLTSAMCAGLLVRSYLRSKTRLLMWSAACFTLLAVNNLLLVIDLLVLPSIDLGILRSLSSLAAVTTLLYGFIWETE